jgi:ketosteroid isomerase-like protein
MRLTKLLVTTALVTTAALLLTNSITTLADEPTHTPATSHAAQNAALISKVDHALHDYLLASSRHDAQAIANSVTGDAVFEYALEEPGSYLTVDATSLRAHWSNDTNTQHSSTNVSNLWIFPTGDPNAVFVRYTTSTAAESGTDAARSEHLALVEMRGDRIAKLRDFTSSANVILTAASR